MLTSEELQALDSILEEAILRSNEEDDGDPVFHEVNVNDVNPFKNKHIQTDIFNSLSKQGLIECSGTEDLSGKEVIEYVCITQKGLEAIKSMKGVH